MMYKSNIEIPKNIKFVMEKLKEAGYEAYTVGGGVRDSLLGREPKDWDLTTNATPEKIKEVFKDYIIIDNNGEKHGTVTVRYNDENIEITTFRVDGEYTDNRHPDSVHFTTNLKEDLARRDFTINAIACDGENLIDYFEGIKDLENGIIRAVGSPKERFEEDALRILRGIRFACKYNFKIDNSTIFGMFFKRDNLKNISKERILVEIKEIFSYPKISEFMQGMMIRSVIEEIIPEFRSLNEQVFKLIDYDFTTNFAGLLTLVHADMFHDDDLKERILDNLKFSKAERKKLLLLSIFSKCKYDFTNSDMIVKIMHIFIDQYHYTKEEAYDMVRDLIKIQNKFLLVPNAYNKDYEDNAAETLTKTVEERCVCIKDLAINGNDLIELGYKGAEIGGTLQNILMSIADHDNYKIKNNRTELLQYSKELIIKK